MKRHRRSQAQRLLELLERHTRAIRDAVLQAVANAREALDFATLLEAVEARDWLRIVELLRIDDAAAWPLLEACRSAFVEAAAATAAGLRGTFSFNGRHIRAEQTIAATGARLVSEFGSPGAEPIRAILLAGQEQGIGAKKIALQLAGTINPATGMREGGILGLDAVRAMRAVRVREILSDPARIAEYFEGGMPRYTRTDRRFDPMVRRAISEGRALSAADVERIARAHEARLLKDRADTIARTEAFTAQAQGRNEVYRQLLESGAVEAIKKEWRHATLRHPRPDHKALDGAVLDFDEPFVMDDGARLQYPHDPSAGPEHRIGCRCSVIYRPQFRKD